MVKKPDMCTRCFNEEDLGIYSARQSWNERWPTECTEINPKLNIRYADIRLGNLCNLKCRMCNPYASNQWVDEWPKIEPDTLPEKLLILKKMQWFDNPAVWKNLADISANIEEIYLTGGEPTLAISQYKLFDMLIQADIAKHIKLKYNTNLTNIPSKMVEYWSHFKQVKINASIDAVGELNRYIRFPSDWNTIDKNLKIFNNLVKIGNCILQIHITVQIYNIMYLDKLLDYLKENGYNNIFLNILDHPEYLNVKSLPLELKNKVSNMLTTYSYVKKINGLISYINSQDWYSTQWQNFCNYTKTLDMLRGQSLINAAPIFKNFI